MPSGRSNPHSDLIRQFLAENPSLPSRTCARILFKAHPDKWNDVEHVNCIIRYQRNANGEKNRGRGKFPNPANLPSFHPPESDEDNWQPFELPKISRWGIVSDIHVPYHSISAVTTTFQYFRDQGVKAILMNGDIIDCYQLSDFVRDPRKRDMAFEIEQTARLLDAIEDYLPGVPVWFKIGNHEERLERFLWVKAKELLGFDMFRIGELIQANQRGITMIEDQRVINLGKLRIVHGHELAVSGHSVNPARSLFLKAKRSALMGHSHVVSEHTEPDIDGQITTCWSTGCLSELHPRYARINKWSHGFAIVDVESDGSFSVSNRRIYNGKIL